MSRSGFTYNARPYLPSSPATPAAARPAIPTARTPFAPPSADDRFSTASAGAPFSAIGNLLASPYDTDDSDADEIRTPGTPVDRGQAVKVKGDRRKTQTRQVPQGHLQSVAGELEVSAFAADGTPRTPTSPWSRSGIRYIPSKPGRETGDSHGEKRLTIIDFPTPSLTPEPRTPDSQRRAHAAAGPAYPSPSRPGLLSPFHTPSHPDARLTLHLHTNLPPPRAMPHLLPPPASPISPMLAAPPPSHPRFLGSVDAHRSSTTSTNESIAGYDLMREKKALFRGGEDELLAFSPRGTRRPGKSALGKRQTMGRMSTVDFWKRFSTMGNVSVAQQQQLQAHRQGANVGSAKESEWLATQQSGRRSIRKWVIIGLILFALVVASIGAYFVIATQQKAKQAVVSGKDI